MASVIRKTRVVDASNKSLGRVATEIARLLVGKNKSSYKLEQDCGDVVVVRNLEKIRFTGQKFVKKQYYRFSGYPGGIRSDTMRSLWRRDPNEVLRRAVRKMLPANTLRKARLRRLNIDKS